MLAYFRNRKDEHLVTVHNIVREDAKEYNEKKRLFPLSNYWLDYENRHVDQCMRRNFADSNQAHWRTHEKIVKTAMRGKTFWRGGVEE